MNAAPRYDLAAITPAMQDYLKAMYHLQDEGDSVTTQRLAEALSISSPSVTNMIKRLHELGLARHTRYRGVELTETGEQAALEVVRHHRLLELYLVDMLGFQWDEAHAEAECLEHHVSEKMEARIDAALGHPTHDPHGDPIPSQDGAVAELSDTRLLDLESGEGGIIVRVSDRDPEQLRYLGELGLYPGVAVAVLEKLPFEGPLRIRVGDATHLISPPLAAVVRVQELPSWITS
jgi:DtxR family Mn-dependent transcriptional regulator